MKADYDAHPFWGSASPLAALSGGCLLILASSRLSFALINAGSLIWVYCLTSLTIFAARPILPQKGKQWVFIFLSAIIGSLYLLILWFVSPLLVLDTFFFLILSPVCCIASGLFERMWPVLEGPRGSTRFPSPEIAEVFSRSFTEAWILAALILALSLIREPIGFASLSFPGGVHGIVTLFSAKNEGFFPIRLAASSAGALILMGYGIALYKRLRWQYVHEGER
ncbi:hypothetical protein AGMMS50268_28550 [Spirochaetia bacterium]|nr:hypothetical protein AGMMS50268_28550 [Spirochaetia bacterium]